MRRQEKQKVLSSMVQGCAHTVEKSHHHWSENRIICPSAYMQLRLHVRACCHCSFVLGVVNSSAGGGNTHGAAHRSGEILHLTDLFYSTLYQRSSRKPPGRSATKSSITFFVLGGANGWWCSSTMMRCFYSTIPNSISHDFLPFRSGAHTHKHTHPQTYLSTLRLRWFYSA